MILHKKNHYYRLEKKVSNQIDILYHAKKKKKLHYNFSLFSNL